jgi:hypothetical protein
VKPCHATYTAAADGFVFTCDDEQGHAGPHHSVEFDLDLDAFRFADWDQVWPTVANYSPKS